MQVEIQCIFSNLWVICREIFSMWRVIYWSMCFNSHPTKCGNVGPQRCQNPKKTLFNSYLNIILETLTKVAVSSLEFVDVQNIPQMDKQRNRHFIEVEEASVFFVVVLAMRALIQLWRICAMSYASTGSKSSLLCLGARARLFVFFLVDHQEEKFPDCYVHNKTSRSSWIFWWHSFRKSKGYPLAKFIP